VRLIMMASGSGSMYHMYYVPLYNQPTSVRYKNASVTWNKHGGTVVLVWVINEFHLHILTAIFSNLSQAFWQDFVSVILLMS